MAVAFNESGIQWIVGVRSGRRGTGHTARDSRFPICPLPGLFDCHTHTNMPGDGRTGEEVDRDDSDDVRLLRSACNVNDALSTGVTSLCDCGSWNNTAFSLKEGLSQGIVSGPRTLVSGPPLTITGGPVFMGGQTDGIDNIRARVRERVCRARTSSRSPPPGEYLTSDPYRASYTWRDEGASG